uniref:Uncharacterized protein n=1 Tax=Sphenodon punctatus TaxID=8508 RepID=A0A8D0GG18_SPHPU
MGLAVPSRQALPHPRVTPQGLLFFVLLGPSQWPPVMTTPIVNVLNGTAARFTCTFTSCYKVDNKQFSLNWTYQECHNCSEETGHQAGNEARLGQRLQGEGQAHSSDWNKTKGGAGWGEGAAPGCAVTGSWAGPALGVRFRRPPPISFPPPAVPTVTPPGDSTVAVIVGASVGGFLAVLILGLVIVKCVRRKKQQTLNTDDQKTEEDGKTDGEGNPEEGTK